MRSAGVRLPLPASRVQTFRYCCVPHPGLAAFRPLSACATVDNIYADLQPVQRGEPLASDEELARFFD
jgi:hypothetical protein